MIESPVLQEIIAETKQKAIVEVLTARFGEAAKDVEAELKAVDDDRLDQLLRHAAKCRNLASFRKNLSS